MIANAVIAAAGRCLMEKRVRVHAVRTASAVSTAAGRRLMVLRLMRILELRVLVAAVRRPKWQQPPCRTTRPRIIQEADGLCASSGLPNKDEPNVYEPSTP